MKLDYVFRQMSIKFLTTCILSSMIGLDAARILAVFPTPSISHQIVFRPLTQELARRGHEVIVITADPAFPKGQSPENLTEIDVKDISYKIWREKLKEIPFGSKGDIVAQRKMIIYLYLAISELQFRNKEIQDLINNKDKKFDLLLVESCVRPALIYSHFFNAPVVLVSSMGPMIGVNVAVGATNHPLFQPIHYRQKVFNLTICETIREVYRQFEYEIYVRNCEENAFLRKTFGPDTPTFDELYKNVDMAFINANSIWNRNSPVPPAMIYMGGLLQQTIIEKELPKDLQSYLDSATSGVIYVSFGTNVPSSVLSPESIQMMIRVLSELPYEVIWKWDTDLPVQPSNIKVLKWLPQSDLLRHPNLRLFITQGGVQSTDEAIFGGVPLICIPMVSDQWGNAEKYVHLGIGKKLEIEEFTEEDFRSAVVTVIENHTYRNNMRRLRSLVLDQPQSPLERTVRWVEHVVRHGGARHLRCPAANMSWTEYYELELILFVLTILLLILILIILIVVYFLRMFYKDKIITNIFGYN